MVSVIIPVYNGAEFLEDCLRSVMNQTYRDIEILVIDDGSTDESYEICKRLAKEDNRIRLYHQENAGVSSARNKGLNQATGEYLTLVDADDLIPENAIDILVNALHDDVDLVIGSYAMFRGNKIKNHIKKSRKVGNSIFYNEPLYIEEHLRGVHSKLYKKSIIESYTVRYNESLPFMEDTLFTWNYCKYVNGIQIISDVVYLNRKGGVASTVKYYPQRTNFLLSAIETYSEFYGGEEYIPRDLYNVKITAAVLDCTNHYLVHCSRKTAIYKVKETLQLFEPYLLKCEIDKFQCSDALADAICRRDAVAMVSILYPMAIKSVLVKRIKKGLYYIFRKRI